MVASFKGHNKRQEIRHNRRVMTLLLNRINTFLYAIQVSDAQWEKINRILGFILNVFAQYFLCQFYYTVTFYARR